MLMLLMILSFITRFVIIFDLNFVLIAKILFILSIYLSLKKYNIINFKYAFYIIILEIPIVVFEMLSKSSISITGLFDVLLFYNILKGLLLSSPTSKNNQMINYLKYFIFFHIIGTGILENFIFLPPQISSNISRLFIFIGIIITMLIFLVLRNIKKTGGCNER